MSTTQNLRKIVDSVRNRSVTEVRKGGEKKESMKIKLRVIKYEGIRRSPFQCHLEITTIKNNLILII